MTSVIATEESATESNHDATTKDANSEVRNGKPNEEATKKTKNSKSDKQEPAAVSGPGDWSFPYRLASEWSVWYDKPAQKKQSRTDYNSSMKHIYQFDSVKAFWGLYNHLNLDKMPVGANLRIFKSNIQPTWEDDKNREGGNWILVPRGEGRDQRAPGLLVFKELLLAIIGGDLDNLVNGIVLSIKAKDIIIQIWLQSTGPRRRNKVRTIAEGALKQYCPQFVDEPGKPRLEWTWRAHPTATLLKKPGDVDEEGEVDVPQGEGSRGSCGECLQNRSCAVM